MRLRRPPRTATPDETNRAATWAEITAGAEAPVVVIHARRASEIVDAQQVA